jgi:hypothetical protein
LSFVVPLKNAPQLSSPISTWSRKPPSSDMLQYSCNTHIIFVVLLHGYLIICSETNDIRHMSYLSAIENNSVSMKPTRAFTYTSLSYSESRLFSTCFDLRRPTQHFSDVRPMTLLRGL